MMERPPGHLLNHLLAFGYLLREMGVQVSPGQMLELIAALEYVPLTSRENLHATARCILVKRREDLPLFDAAFAFFWRNLTGHSMDDEMLYELLPTLRLPRRRLRLPRRQPNNHADDGDDQDSPEEQEQVNVVLTYSANELLREKDFGQFTWEEVQACKALLQQMQWRLDERPTRRKRPSRAGRQLDFRRTLRQNMRYGGEPLQLVWRETRTQQRPLIVLCDISGSMERYSRILLQFVHTISNGLKDVEAFVFGTRLTRITRHLRQRDIDDAIDAVTGQVVDWSGGTRIGDAVKGFNFLWGRRVLGRGSVVLLISDGWDRGEPELLQREMGRLQRSCHRLIWLNPLLGNPNYEPLTLGMQAALPFVDDFLAVHNLNSLEQLGEKLSALGAARPARGQHSAIQRG
ncbi:MAG: VWA domain-containing protein [Chloroflexales bacterium]|nr:VWA domain-containing protein [Chloroflexales bacterium]